jgi:hypothetical protein
VKKVELAADHTVPSPVRIGLYVMGWARITMAIGLRCDYSPATLLEKVRFRDTLDTIIVIAPRLGDSWDESEHVRKREIQRRKSIVQVCA